MGNIWRWFVRAFWAGVGISVALIVFYFAIGLVRRYTPAPISTVAGAWSRYTMGAAA